MHKTTLAFLLIIIIFGCSKKEKYEINGSIKNGINGIRAYLKEQNFEGRFVDIDTSIIYDKKILFEGYVKEPTLAYLFINNYENRLPLVLSNETIDIEIDESNIFNSKINNSDLNFKFYNYVNSIKKLEDNLFYEKNNFQKALFNGDSVLAKKAKSNYYETAENLIAYNTKYISQNSNSFISLFIIQKNLINKIFPLDTIKNQYSLLSKDLKKTTLANQINQYISFKKAELINSKKLTDEN